MQLLSALAIPVVLAAAGLWFTAQQDQRQQEIEGQRAKQAQKIEDQRAKAERELADQRAQDEELQAYLNQMSQLMLERKLQEAEPGDPVYTLAQARTSTVILRLDAEHNASVIRFLRDSGLAWSASARLEGTSGGPAAVDTRPPPASVSLLSGIALNRADLSGADLSWADLSNADLSGADLRDAYLAWSFLHNAKLNGAKLQGADLRGDPHQRGDADLSEANLSEANLSEADLSYDDLSSANLQGANLTDAVLRGANLSNAKVTSEQLAEAKSLEGATMPNGQKYEDWLKSKDQEENKKSDGSS